MDGFESRYFDVQNWEITALGDEYYRMLQVSGYEMTYAPLTQEDLEQLVDVYHYWKILLGCSSARFGEMDMLLHGLHFDVIIELFCHRKLQQRMKLDLIFRN